MRLTAPCKPRVAATRATASVMVALTVLLCLPMVVASAAPAAPIDLRWSLDDNVYPPVVTAARSRGLLDLHNHGSEGLGASGWSLYFTSAATLTSGDTEQHLRIVNQGGSYYRVSPLPGFEGVAPGQSFQIRLPYADLVLKDTEAPLGAFLVLDRAPDVGMPIAHYEIAPRVRAGQLPRDTAERAAQLTPEVIFERNAAIADVADADLPPLLPTPLHYERGAGVLHWAHRPRVVAAPALGREAALAGRILGRAFADPGPVATEPPLKLRLQPIPGLASPEAYALTVDAATGVELSANTASGLSRGLQTLRALLPSAPVVGGASLPAWRISDAPRFGYRGLEIDVARNFQPKEFVLRYLDVMARFKLNTLHMHLTDDEGWRLEIAGLPELTAVGGRRGHSSDPLRHLPPAHGSGPDVTDPHGSGHYTRSDFQAILRHAASLHIEVIPEIEMPGHARSQVIAMRSRAEKLARAGDPAAQRFRLDDPADRSVYESAQSFTDNVMNPALESTYTFIDHVLGEVVALYREAGVPLKTIHVGGDELPAGAWERSPACEALKARRHLASTADVWNYFYTRVDRLLMARGLQASGWEEIGSRRAKIHGVDKLIPNPAFVNHDFRVYVWNDLWGAEDLGMRLANAGYKTILAPVSAFYLDMAYNQNYDEPGGKWAPFIDIDAAYDFVPYDFVRRTATDPTPVSGRDGLSDFGRSNILGLEAEMWSETMREPRQIEYLLMPRLIAFAERAWAADPAWAQASDAASAGRLYASAWSTFMNQLGRQVLPHIDAEADGIGYRIPPPGLRRMDGKVEANSQLPGFTLRYTTDGEEPTAASARVTGPIASRAMIRVAAFASNGRAGRSSQIDNR